MPSSGKVRVVRILEMLLSLIFLGGALFIFGAIRDDLAPIQILLTAVGVEMLLALIIYYLRRKVDNWLLIAASQKSFKHNAEFISLYERSPIAYVTIKLNGEVDTFNQASVHLFGATADTMRQVNFFKRIVPTEGFNQSVFEGKIKSGVIMRDQDVLLRSARGGEVWVTMSIYPHSDAELRLVSLIDVTEKKKVDKAKSEFVALATHQLRTPISAIRWNVELLDKKLKNTATEDQARYLIKINRNVSKMIALINDFLNVSKLETGTFANTPEPVNLSEFFTATVDEFAEKISKSNLKISRLDKPENSQVNLDTRLLHIIVSNLLSNSVKYTPDNGKVAISYEVVGGQLKIVISDTGIGIPKKEIETLFTKFFRASNAQSFQTEGTGLGLYVVKQSVEKLRGEISVRSEEGEGTAFEVIIPLDS